MSNGSAMGHSSETEWTWKPAIQGRDRRSQPQVIVGAMIVLAVSCAVAGFVAGRWSGGYHTPHGRDVAGPAAAPPISVPRVGERSASPPSSPAASAVVIINPGTADAGRQEPARPILSTDGRTPETRVKQPPTDPARADGSRAGAAAERDYLALRDYMLSR